MRISWRAGDSVNVPKAAPPSLWAEVPKTHTRLPPLRSASKHSLAARQPAVAASGLRRGFWPPARPRLPSPFTRKSHVRASRVHCDHIGVLLPHDQHAQRQRIDQSVDLHTHTHALHAHTHALHMPCTCHATLHRCRPARARARVCVNVRVRVRVRMPRAARSCGRAVPASCSSRATGARPAWAGWS